MGYRYIAYNFDPLILYGSGSGSNCNFNVLAACFLIIFSQLPLSIIKLDNLLFIKHRVRNNIFHFKSLANFNVSNIFIINVYHHRHHIDLLHHIHQVCTDHPHHQKTPAHINFHVDQFLSFRLLWSILVWQSPMTPIKFFFTNTLHIDNWLSMWIFNNRSRLSLSRGKSSDMFLSSSRFMLVHAHHNWFIYSVKYATECSCRSNFYGRFFCAAFRALMVF